MPTIDVTKADEHDCLFSEFNPCRGPRCMARSWLGAPFDFSETDNLVDTEEGQRPIGEPRAPDTTGQWETDGPPFKKGYHRSGKDNLPPATAQRWRRQRAVMTGFCGRVGPDREYY